MPTVRQVRIAREFRANLTPAEATLWRELKTWRAQGWRWRRQAPLQWWWLDFACFTHRMVVEVDGVHHELDPEQQAHDARRDAVLEREGFAVLRFRNDEVRYELERVLKTIRDTGLGRRADEKPAG